MNARTLVVTGPIGSGKSTLSKLIESFGVPRVDLDEISRVIIETEESRQFIRENWPEAMDGTAVDRAVLARVVFGDHSQLRKLEEYVHPRVLAELHSRYAGQAPIVVEVSVPSIRIENAYVLVLDTTAHIRIARLLQRGMNPGDVESRMKAQPDRALWLSLASGVIPNDGSETLLASRAASFWSWWSSHDA